VNLLLDTHIAIWSATNSPKLSHSARSIIERASARYISAASIWEMALKSRKLKIDVARIAERFAEAGIVALPVTWEHAVRSAEIAATHPDPFDRLLLAQAIHEPMHLLTSDAALARYSEHVIEV
jgi:PIN domain nuclease of toxin-antitoxin system